MKKILLIMLCSVSLPLCAQSSNPEYLLPKLYRSAKNSVKNKAEALYTNVLAPAGRLTKGTGEYVMLPFWIAMHCDSTYYPKAGWKGALSGGPREQFELDRRIKAGWFLPLNIALSLGATKAVNSLFGYDTDSDPVSALFPHPFKKGEVIWVRDKYLKQAAAVAGIHIFEVSML